MVIWLGLAVLLVSTSLAQAAGRVAMVLSSEDYGSLGRSEIGIKRGNDIAEALKALDFDVVVSTNPSNASARAALREFSGKVADADLALVVLIGHGTSSAGQTFYLPVNTEITRATDLLSRGLSINNVAAIAGRAKGGAVMFLMTSPNFATPVEGLDPRPQFGGDEIGNVVVSFSTSNKMPVSGTNLAGVSAADAVVARLAGKQIPLAALIKAAASDGEGLVKGTAMAVDLAQVPKSGPVNSDADAAAQAQKLATETAAAERAATEQALAAERAARLAAEKQIEDEKARQAQAEAQRSQEAERLARELALKAKQGEAAEQAKAETEKALQAERQAREEAERRITEEKARIAKAEAERQAEAEARAREQEEKAKQAEQAAQEKAQAARALEAEKLARELAEQRNQEAKALIEQAKADAQRAQANAQQAKLEAQEAEQRAKAAEQNSKIQSAAAQEAQSAAEAALARPVPGPSPDQLASLELVEALISESQRRRIQSKLRRLGFYEGELDAVMGRLTRRAIADYQKSTGAPETGYLTPDQLQALLKSEGSSQ